MIDHVVRCALADDAECTCYVLRAAPKRNALLVVVALASVACAHPAIDRTFTAGDTMVPTLAVGARVAVKALEREPLRGDVIVFRAPERPDREYVKRVVGMPGETIASNGPEIRVNGVPIAQCDIGPFSYVEADGKSRAGEIWLEAFGGASWLVFHSTAEKSIPTGPWTVAPGEVFVLGDSRENSHDSRFWYGGKGGGLPFSFIVGTAVGVGEPVLPQRTEALAPALATCTATLAK